MNDEEFLEACSYLDLTPEGWSHQDIQDLLDNRVNDYKAVEAMNINNKGVSNQIEFLRGAE